MASEQPEKRLLSDAVRGWKRGEQYGERPAAGYPSHGKQAAAPAPASSSKGVPKPDSLLDTSVQRVRWVEWGKEHWSEFCEATDPSGHFESNSSQGHKEYQDRLKAIALRQEGMGKAEIAKELQRSQQFVQTWWRKEPKEVPRPAGVHEYLKTEYWRDIQVLRGFAKGLGVYEEALHKSEWQQQMAWGNDFRNGGRIVKYDKEGRMRPMGNQQAKGGYRAGSMPNLDKVTQKMLSELNIQDRVLTQPGLLWYPDGSADAIPHRHECWTALLSFGTPRILTIDGNPILLRDGDLIVFGTQRHGVPQMHPEGEAFEDYGGRISAVFFFMPQGQAAQGANPWRPIIDGPGGGRKEVGSDPSRQLTAWTRDRDLGAPQQLAGLRAGPKAEDLTHLRDLGFSEEEAAAALRATSCDVERAAEVLLSGGASALLLGGFGDGFDDGLDDGFGDSLGSGALKGKNREQQLAALYAQLETLHCGACCGAHAISSAGASASSSSGDIPTEDDAALALRLQQEEESGGFGGGFGAAEAILAQIQELEEEDAGSVDHEALQAQFQQYEEMLDRADASEWDGRGDLMAWMSKREHLHIEQQEPAALYALGCGRAREKDFFELLSLHSVRVLYDLRADVEASCPHFLPQSLRVSCKAHAIVYRHVALGRDGAYGILKHLREDEGRNTLAELVWQAQRKRTAFLGADADWKLDHRQAIASRLVEARHSVLHVLSDGSTEAHPKQHELPEFIIGEEARLRKLEKQRLAGEAQPQKKSAAGRSTEAIAQKLTAPPKVVDAGAELRKATNQTELCRIQRRLADLQRKSESTDAKAGLGPKLLGVNKWVKAEAAQQRENLAAGKTKDGKERKTDNDGPAPAYAWLGTGGTSGGNPLLSGNARAVPACGEASDQPSEESHAVPKLMVECGRCGVVLPWDVLETHDGICPDCAAQGVQEDGFDAFGGCVGSSAPGPGDTAPTDTAPGAAEPGAETSRLMPEAIVPEAALPEAAVSEVVVPEVVVPEVVVPEAAGCSSGSSWRARRHQSRKAQEVA